MMDDLVKARCAPRPPMGWNSWDCFGVDVTEAEVKANANFMEARLADVGWEYVVVDLAWYGLGLTAKGEQYKMQRPPQLIDAHGRFTPNPEWHPSAADGAGFKPLADYIHAKGLKFGIHIMRGLPWQAAEQRTPILGTDYTADEIAVDDERCPWYNGMVSIDMTHPGGQAYYDSIAALYASWDVDFIKADDMNSWTGEGGSFYRVDEVEGIAKAIAKTGRDMVLSLSPGGAQINQAAHLHRHAHMWRISADFWDNWDALKNQFDLCAKWAPFTKAHGWPDADMLPMGKISIRAEVGEPRTTNFTRDEQVAMLSLWALARSPLMFGGHLPDTDEETIALISNADVIAVNQESRDGREIARDGDLRVWRAAAPDGGAYLGLFNLGDAPMTNVDARGDYGVAGAARDLWAPDRDIDAGVDIPAHGARLFHFASTTH